MQDTLTEEIFIDASPQRVFAAWTEAAQLIAWWGDGTEFRTVAWTGDVRPGGHFQIDFVAASGHPFSARGEFVRVERPAFLSFIWRPDWDNGASTTIELEFQSMKSGTLLRLKQWGFANPAARESNRQAWAPTANWLRDYLEKAPADGP